VGEQGQFPSDNVSLMLIDCLRKMNHIDEGTPVVLATGDEGIASEHV
jgi:hypothetical protein